jgi:hypothetical protein
VNGHAHYRCTLKAPDHALAVAGHPRTVYLREDKIVEQLDAWLGQSFEPARKTKRSMRVEWLNHRRLYEYCGDIPPRELEAAYCAQTTFTPPAKVSHQ